MAAETFCGDVGACREFMGIQGKYRGIKGNLWKFRIIMGGIKKGLRIDLRKVS